MMRRASYLYPLTISMLFLGACAQGMDGGGGGDDSSDDDPAVCGDGFCNGDETQSSCADDCGGDDAECGDGSCNGTETINTCPGDCGGEETECGDDECNGHETPTSCPDDCGGGPVCGDGNCNGGETADNCPEDCTGGGGGGGGECVFDFVCDTGNNECEMLCFDCFVVDPNSCASCTGDVCGPGPARRTDCDACTTAVCEQEPFCCNPFFGAWDQLCADLVAEHCEPGTCP
jgi:hypothetical protein